MAMDSLDIAGRYFNECPLHIAAFFDFTDRSVSFHLGTQPDF